MSIIPSKLLSVFISSINAIGFWNEDDGNDPWLGYPYQWEMTLSVSSQPHSNPNTPTPFFYTGTDITEGMWISGDLNGFCWKIISISSSDASNVTCIVEDIDRYNIFSDPLQSGAYPTEGNAVVFDLNQEGVPVLTGIIPNSFSSTFVTDLMSRFYYRNLSKQYIRVFQENHNLSVGDPIYMKSDGTYSTLTSSQENKNNLLKIVGSVTTIGTPGINWFTYKPRGILYTDINPTFPVTSNPGDLIYLSPFNDGELTEIKPTTLSTPIYIRLETLDKGIYLMGGSGSSNDSPLGYYSLTYVVETLQERNSLDVSLLNIGDQVFVKDTGQGEWGVYVLREKSGDPEVATWIKISDYDSSQTDARTISVDITSESSSTIDVYRISPLRRVVFINVDIIEVFHSSATLSIGDDNNNSRLVDNSDIDLTEIDNYQITPSYQYSGSEETMIRIYLDPGTSSTGQAKITLTYV